MADQRTTSAPALTNTNPGSTLAPAAVPAAPTPAAPTATEALLAQTLAALAQSNERITGLMEQQAAYNRAALKIAPRRKKSMGEYLAERKKKGISKHLPHLVYQNGRQVNPSGLSEETIKTLDQLATGNYCDGLVNVIRITDGVDGLNTRIHLRYNNGSDMERMQFYLRFPSFTSIVQQISTEMKARSADRVDDQGNVVIKGDSKYLPVIEKGMDAPEFDFPDELAALN